METIIKNTSSQCERDQSSESTLTPPSTEAPPHSIFNFHKKKDLQGFDEIVVEQYSVLEL